MKQEKQYVNIEINKVEAAERQIVEAIKLFFAKTAILQIFFLVL